ncbi:MAG TPA: rhomboid family intramembrane serine protease [Ktedonobacterales bacterium]|nr:rhomboid family intramembrane serine protease [Ktedonobacterales bacterium]
MEQTIDVRSLIEQGDAQLKEIEPRAAAALYAQAAQQDPTAVGAHLGLAEANLALGQFPIAVRASEEVLRLAPGTADAALAQAIIAVIERRYVDALSQLEVVAELDPPRAYAHALRGYCLRQLHQPYDASLAESKAARLSGTHGLNKLFPQVAPAPALVALPGGAASAAAIGGPSMQPGPSRVSPPVGPRPWDQRSPVERQVTRARFATRNIPIATYTLIAINTFVYLVCLVLSGFNLTDTTGNVVTLYGIAGGTTFALPDPFRGSLPTTLQQDPLQAYRVVTAMFLHESILHIGLNMVSLFFVGIITEQVFGRGRFLAIYFLTGIAGGLLEVFLIPNGAALGASGAIFGIFGAFGAFLFLRRRALGPALNGLIYQWVFFLVINIAFSFTGGIALYDHLGGVVAGLLLGALLMPGSNRRRRAIV